MSSLNVCLLLIFGTAGAIGAYQVLHRLLSAAWLTRRRSRLAQAEAEILTGVYAAREDLTHRAASVAQEPTQERQRSSKRWRKEQMRLAGVAAYPRTTVMGTDGRPIPVGMPGAQVITTAGTLPQTLHTAVAARAGMMIVPDSEASDAKPIDPSQRNGVVTSLERGLLDRVVEQDEAVRAVVETIEEWQAGMAEPGRPVGNLLFLGPTGSGKTRLVEATAEVMVGDARAVIKIDCAEFQHSHEIAKLIGSPPGYLGHRETHPLLSQERLNQFQTDKCKLAFVLFDEIEKASDALWNLLLGILDKASLTLGDNRRVDFSNAIIFMTSNLGAREMTDSERKPGFVQEQVGKQGLEKIGMEAARRRFSPEFWNRIDNIVTFGALSQEAMNKIILIELAALQNRIYTRVGSAVFSLVCTESAKAYLVQAGFDKRYGARHLKRALKRLLVKPLSRLMAAGQIPSGAYVIAAVNDEQNGLVFKLKK